MKCWRSNTTEVESLCKSKLHRNRQDMMSFKLQRVMGFLFSYVSEMQMMGLELFSTLYGVVAQVFSAYAALPIVICCRWNPGIKKISSCETWKHFLFYEIISSNKLWRGSSETRSSSKELGQ